MADKTKEFFKTKVYYGEYSLRHWLDLMLSRNIVLPEYQRYFVWEEPDVIRLMESLESGQFVMPVTIAHYKASKENKNLILDGQQRLTSILLAFLGFMPIKNMFKPTEEDLAIGDDSMEEPLNSPMEWTYKLLLEKKSEANTINKIKERLRTDDRYSRLSKIFDRNIEDFYDNTYLGFSFIMPDSDEPILTQNYFSTLFRHMNYFGKKLSSLESRRSLYYMNIDYKNYFDGKLENGDDVLCGIKLLENMAPKMIDFVRYLAMLSQFVYGENEKKVMVGYSAYSSREAYYADYVSYLVNVEQDDRKDKFDSFQMKEIFPNNEWKLRFMEVRSFLERNKEQFGLDLKYNAFTSWIDADYWLFGLLYYVVFKGKKLSKEKDLIAEVKKAIKEKRGLPKEDDYSKNPNRLGNLRDRMKKSIDIYEHYAE